MDDIPKTLKNFKSYHDNFYNQFISDRRANLDKIKVVETFLQQTIEKNDLCLRVRTGVLNSIIKDNRIKGLPEIGKGATLGGAEARIHAVKELFQINPEQLGKTDYPKYGYIACKNKMLELFKNSSLSYQYGDVMITLKKERLAERTTMTVGDSMNFADFMRKVPTFIADPKIICIRGDAHSNSVPLLNQIRLKSRFFYVDQIYQYILDNTLSAEKPYLLSEVFEENGFEFFELQFHGNIQMDRDIERVDYYPISEEDEANFREIMALLQDRYNIPCKILSTGL